MESTSYTLQVYSNYTLEVCSNYTPEVYSNYIPEVYSTRYTSQVYSSYTLLFPVSTRLTSLQKREKVNPDLNLNNLSRARCTMYKPP